MPDHEPDFTDGLVKPAPTAPDVPVYNPNLGIPTGFSPGVPPGFHPQAPNMPPMAQQPYSPFSPQPAHVPPAPPNVTPVAQFQFIHEGTNYAALVTGGSAGYAIDLRKWQGGAWVPSVSRLRYGILGYFIAHDAMTKAGWSAAKAAVPEPIMQTHSGD